jgi:hypothetical protein
MALSLANVQVSDTFQTWFTRTNEIIDAAFPASGGTVAGDLTVTGDATFSGNTTIVNKTTVSTTDALLQLASNNEFTDILDIGFFAHFNDGTGGVGANNHTGLIRDAVTKEYYFFSEFKTGDELTTNIDINHASFKLANVNVKKITSTTGSFTTVSANTISVLNTVTANTAVFTSSGAITLPVGNTGQQPGSPSTGMIRFNSDNNTLELYNGSSFTTVGGQSVGGTAAGVDLVYFLAS